jgi:hypothetical protein
MHGIDPDDYPSASELAEDDRPDPTHRCTNPRCPGWEWDSSDHGEVVLDSDTVRGILYGLAGDEPMRVMALERLTDLARGGEVIVQQREWNEGAVPATRYEPSYATVDSCPDCGDDGEAI